MNSSELSISKVTVPLAFSEKSTAVLAINFSLLNREMGTSEISAPVFETFTFNCVTAAFFEAI